MMEENLIDEFKPEIQDALFDIAEDILNTREVKIHVDPGSKKGAYICNVGLNLFII